MKKKIIFVLFHNSHNFFVFSLIKFTLFLFLLGLIKYFLQREVTAKEAIPVVTFMLALRHEAVLTEITEMLLHYLESKVAKDQMFLVLYEAKRADLLYNLLLDKNFSVETRLTILKLLSCMLQTPRVASRYKTMRMHLGEYLLVI